MTVRTLTIAFALLRIAAAGADQLTIPQVVKLRAPEPVLLTRIRELVPVTFEETIENADLVVHGTVAPMRTYLSDDQKELYTDYAITPLRVVFQRHVVGSQVPGVAQPIVVKRWGGRMVIDGVQVTVEDMNLASFENGAELVLILRSSEDGKYRIAKEIAGVLGVRGGLISPTIRSVLKSEQLMGMTVAQFEAEVVRRLRP